MAKYDLTANPEAFAILTRSPADCYKVLNTLSAEEASRLRKQDTCNNVKFWSGDKRHYGGFRNRFDELLGTMGVAAVGIQATVTKYYTVD